MTTLSILKRALAVAALGGMLAACGGGGGSRALPPVGNNANGGSSSQNNNNGGTTLQAPNGKSVPAATLTTYLPRVVGNAQPVVTGAKGRVPQYLDTTTKNSALAITVTPLDPAEAAQYGSFTVCYNLYTNGTLAPSNPPSFTTGTAPSPPYPANTLQVSIAIPAPPGNDTFVLSQYAGQCQTGANAYSAPTPPPGTNGTSNVIAQTQAITINVAPGATNNLNVNITQCNTATPGAAFNGGPCPNSTPAPGTVATNITLGAQVAAVYLGGATPPPASIASAVNLPIPRPLREQGAFITAASQVGVPIPVVGLDSSGAILPGAPATLGTGALPKAGDKIVLTRTENLATGGSANHTKLYVVDAATGAIAQNEGQVGTGQTITLTQLNALATADGPACGACTFTNLGTNTDGDPYVVVMTFDGTAGTQLTSVTISAVATLNGKVQPAISTTVVPQSAIYSSNQTANNGYPDANGGYTAPLGILNVTAGGTIPAAAVGVWVTDGGNVKKVGAATNVAVGGTALGAMTFNSNAAVNQFYAVDTAATLANLQTTPSATSTNSGIYMYDPVAAAAKPVSVQYGPANSYIGFTKPTGIVYDSSVSTFANQLLYVAEASSNSIWAITVAGNGAGGVGSCNGAAFVCAVATGKVPVTGLNLAGTTMTGMLLDSAGNLVVADTGNNRIVNINPATGASTVVASGKPFAGLVNAPNGSIYATGTDGQIYAVTGATVASLGLTVAAAVKDGGVGTIAPLPTTAQAPVPSPYAVQGQTANFFNTTPVATLPYTLAPFNPPPIFAAPAQTAVAGAPLNLKPDTSNGTISATAGAAVKAPLGIVYIPAAQAAGNASLTPDSFLFTDSGTVRTLVP